MATLLSAADCQVNTVTPQKNGYEDRYLDLVRSVQPGDRIAIKSAYTRKHGLPFDSRGHTVSEMAIKAVGTVVANPGDGRRLKVDWEMLDSPRRWFFYTHRETIWKIQPGDWAADGLIATAFEGAEQDIERFRNAPYWRERFGDREGHYPRFRWTMFYQALADKLLGFKEDRSKLVQGLQELAADFGGFPHLTDKYINGREGFIRDICPFTVFGLFNRGLTEQSRQGIAKGLAGLLDVSEPVPTTFEGIPVLMNLNAWFFSYEHERKADDIDALWRVFAAAMAYADAGDNIEEARAEILSAYDYASTVRGVGWNLTCGLYWTRPWTFPPLDTNTREYVRKTLLVNVATTGVKNRSSGQDYLKVVDTLQARFAEESYSVHSFPELSLAAYQAGGAAVADDEETDAKQSQPDAVAERGAHEYRVVGDPYTVEHILQDGCFVERERLKGMLTRLRAKKNLILQGPPGTGKTWLAKRLAYALIGERDERKVRPVQFHPNLSYEDFVRGWRPTGDGKLSLVDGVFMEAITAASDDPSSVHVVVIEEINRGNPAQVFGEMLTLLDADKRTPSEALELCYRREDGERVFVPANLFVIGTMNVADRSLALVDMALRRRFVFIELEPALNSAWRNWVVERAPIDSAVADLLAERLKALNDSITSSPGLGRHYCIGHSYVTPAENSISGDGRDWFHQVVETEIAPLLEEYWFDSPGIANAAKSDLLKGV